VFLVGLCISHHIERCRTADQLFATSSIMRSLTNLCGPPHSNECALDFLSATENKNTTYYAIRKSKRMNILLIRTQRLRKIIADIYTQQILPNQSAECIFSELSRSSPDSATRMSGHTLVDARILYAIHKFLDSMGQNILLLNFSAEMIYQFSVKSGEYFMTHSI